MRILIASHLYAPSVGGIEAVAEMLAEAFHRAGHDVKVVTHSPGSAPSNGVEVVRRPGPLALARLVRWADVVLQNNVSLRTLWAILLLRRPLVVGHHIWLTRPDGRVGWQDRLKRFTLRFAVHVAPSQALAQSLPVPCSVVGNPYRDDLFVDNPASPRSRDLVFVGRFVSDKGADLLIDALSELGRRGVRPTLTIIGTGPEEHALKALVRSRGLANQVEFAGPVVGRELARVLNAHSILVVPSRWQEPFGIVALEGIASGCVVVGSEGGGLRDAIGECGVTFINGDASSLATALDLVLSNSAVREKCRTAAAAHLAKYRRDRVASAYLQVMMAAARS